MGQGGREGPGTQRQARENSFSGKLSYSLVRPLVPCRSLWSWKYPQARLFFMHQELTEKCPKPVAKVTREAEVESYQFSSMVPTLPLWSPFGIYQVSCLLNQRENIYG